MAKQLQASGPPAVRAGWRWSLCRPRHNGAEVGLALLATLAAARTEEAGLLALGYGFSYRIAVGIVLLAIVLVATQLNHRTCQAELAPPTPGRSARRHSGDTAEE
jgi:hypothetical protein